MTDTYRILVTGSRTWGNSILVRSELYAAIDAVLEQRGGLNRPVMVVHGACRSGADAIAAAWCLERANLLPGYIGQEPHPADWNRYGKRAGFLRNEEMVSLGADLCLAFVMPCHVNGCRNRKPHGSHGAEHCAALAERAGIPVRRFTPDDQRREPRGEFDYTGSEEAP